MRKPYAWYNVYQKGAYAPLTVGRECVSVIAYAPSFEAAQALVDQWLGAVV